MPARIVLPRKSAPHPAGMGRPARYFDGDKVAEHLNGKGRLDLADVVALFVHPDSPLTQENEADVDVHGKGQLDIPGAVVAALEPHIFNGAEESRSAQRLRRLWGGSTLLALTRYACSRDFARWFIQIHKYSRYYPRDSHFHVV